MRPEHPERPGKGIFAGLLLLALGVVLLLGNLDVFPVRPTLAQWWPLIAVIIGIKHLVVFPGTRGAISGVFWIATGALLLSSTLGYLNVGIPRLIWPVMIIWFGVLIVLGGTGQCITRAGDRSEP
jgi:hypothetical protein